MKRILAPVVLVLASVFVSLLLGEAALRLLGFSFPSFTEPDEIVGARLRPGMEGWQKEEGVAYVKINSQGLRDREHTLAKPPGTVRIAVLGDSFSEALSVPVEATFWSVLERELTACKAFGGKRIETINFGVSGYGTAQELITLQQRAAAYSPDIVLLAFFPGNDVRNNSRALEPEKMRPFYVLKDGQLELDRSFARDPEFLKIEKVDAERAALQGVRLYQLMRRARAGRIQLHHNAPIAVALAKGEPGGAVPLAGGEPSGGLEAGLDENVFREPADAQWKDAWQVTDRLVSAINDESRRLGARYVVAVLSSAGAVFPDPLWRTRYMAKLGISDLFYPERRLQALGTREGFEVIALAPAMQREADATHTYMHGFDNTVLGFGHWNAAGHAAAGRLIAQRFCGS